MFNVKRLNDLEAFLTGISLPLPPLKLDPTKFLTATVIRPEDLLTLTFAFANLELEKPSPTKVARLKKSVPGDTAYMLLFFPPQSVGEQNFNETISEKPENQAQSRLSSYSNVVFRLDDSLLPLTFDLASLLDACRVAEQVIAEQITSPYGRNRPEELQRLKIDEGWFTAIEAPYRLVLSPSKNTKWQHTSKPETAPKEAGETVAFTALWHTALKSRKPGDHLQGRAVWTPDLLPFNNRTTPDPEEINPGAADRVEIVRLSSDTSLNQAGFEVQPINFDRLMLSGLGAWLKSSFVIPLNNGQYPLAKATIPFSQPATSFSLQEWQHQMTMGRDHFVKVAKFGYLMPFGNAALFITLTQRKFDRTRSGKWAAYLHRRVFIIVREPDKSYLQRDFPFTQVTIKTLISDDLADPSLPVFNQLYLPGTNNFAFRAEVPTAPGNTTPFLFKCQAVDQDGNLVSFSTPMVFVDYKIYGANKVAAAVGEYNKLKDDWAQRDFKGQQVAFAPSEGNFYPKYDSTTQTNRNTNLDTASITFKTTSTAQLPNFVPVMSLASVSVPSLKRLTGTVKDIPAWQDIIWEDTYKDASQVYAGEVFARLKSPSKVTFNVGQAGGLVAPDFGVQGLSRRFGPISDVNHTINGQFVPTEVFGNATSGVKLLGGVSLSTILGGTNLLSAFPTITTQPLPDRFVTAYRFQMPPGGLQTQNIAGIFQFTPYGDSKFVLTTTVTQYLTNKPPEFDTQGILNHFDVSLGGLITLPFTEVKFISHNGQKPDVAVTLGQLQFQGPLTLVQALMEVVPQDGFNDPPNLDVILSPPEQAGVHAGFSLNIPTIGFGIFVMQNLSISAGFYLPFNDKPANLHLAFCEREHPCILTVSALGGGAFFGIDLGIHGVQMIEAAFEFGAAIALNLGVAAGSVSVMGGIYFQLSAGNPIQLTAYIRINGELDVLGIISVSVEFYLALTYQDPNLSGEASLDVSIKIAFFKKTVSMSAHRELKGSDPDFQTLMTNSDWQEYCEAFGDYA